MKTTVFFAGFLAVMALVSCETECPDCPDCPACELEHLGENSEWGEIVKADLMTLFIDIEDLALVRVYNTTGDVLHWSGFDAGDPENDSRQIQVDFLETELMLVFKRYTEGSWTHSLINLRYDDIVTTVVQNVTFLKNGQVFRRANNVLIFVSDAFDPFSMDGSEAMAGDPDGQKITQSREVFRK